MKKILMVLLLCPILAFSQISHWRSGGSGGGNYGAPRMSIPQTQTFSKPNVSQWRNTPPVPQNPRPYVAPTYRRYNYFNPFPYYGMFGYYYATPYYWYDPYGYRVRGYVHHYENGQIDTVRGRPLHVNLGAQFGSGNKIGGYITIGSEGYFIGEFLTTRPTSNTTFFRNGTLSQVDFPLISDEVTTTIVYLGGGKMINHKTGYHVEIGFGNDNVNFRGKDALGYITFPKYNQNFVTAKIGMIHHYKNFGIKLDADPIKGLFTAGFGIHL